MTTTPSRDATEVPTVETEVERLLQHWDHDDKLRYAYRWLRKDGLETGFYNALATRAPVISHALASAGLFECFIEYVALLRVSDPKERAELLHNIEKTPGETWPMTMELIAEDDLPHLAHWLELCAKAELRVAGIDPNPTPVGQHVVHERFGAGVIESVAEDKAVVRFEDGARKRFLTSALTLGSH